MPQHWDRHEWHAWEQWVVPGPHTFTQQKWFVDVLKKQALVGTARKSLRLESISIQSIAGVVQIEDLLSQWRSQVSKRYLLLPIHSWLAQDQKLVTSGFYKSFLKRNMLGWPQLTLNCWPALIKLAVPSDRRELQPYKIPIAGILWHLKIQLARVVGDFNLNLLVLKMCNVGEKWKIPTSELSAILWDMANFQILVFLKHLISYHI